MAMVQIQCSIITEAMVTMTTGMTMEKGGYWCVTGQVEVVKSEVETKKLSQIYIY